MPSNNDQDTPRVVLTPTGEEAAERVESATQRIIKRMLDEGQPGAHIFFAYDRNVRNVMIADELEAMGVLNA